MNKPIRIFLVDDSPYFLEAACDFLQLEKTIQVTGTASDGQEAITQAQQLQPDIILLDLNLGNQSGLDLIPVFKKHLVNTKIILLTIMEDETYHTAAIQAGADGFVSKTEMSRSLIPVIFEVIETPPIGKPKISNKVEQYSLYFDNNPLPMWVYDIETYQFLAVNHAAVKRYGYSVEEFKSMTIKDIRPSEDVPKLVQNVQSITHGIDEAGIWQHLRKDGTLIKVEIVSHTIEYSGRRAELVVAMDVTERLLAENAMRESEERFRSYIQQANDYIFTLNVRGRITSANQAMCETLGYMESELLGRSALELAVPEMRAEAAQVLQRIWSGESLDTVELPIQTRAGRTLIIQIRGRSMFKDGQLIETVHIARDITAQRETEEKLRETQAFMTTLLELTPASIYVLSLDQKFQMVNRQWEQDTLVARADAIGHSLGEIFPADLARKYELDNRQVAQSGSMLALEEWAETPNGIRCYHTLKFPLRNTSGVVETIGGLSLDITERKQAEVKVLENEEKYRLLAENISDVIWILDLQTSRFRYVSPSVEQLRGFSVEEVLSQDMRSALTPQSRKSLEEVLPERLTEFQKGLSRTHLDEIEQPCKDGTTVWTETTTRFMINQATGSVEVYGVSRNITERKRSEEALQKAEAKYRTLVERLPVVVYTSELGENGVWHYISPQIESLVGFTSEEWQADPGLWYRLVHPEDIERQVALEAQAYQKGETFECEYRMFRREGREIWVRDSAFILPPIDDGAPIVQGILTDITDRKQAEKALKDSQTQLQGIVNSAMDAIIAIDEDENILIFNPAAENMFKYPASKALGDSIGRFIPDYYRNQHKESVRAFGRDNSTTRSMEAPTLALTCLRADGEAFPSEVSISLSDFGGQKLYTAIIRDITERKHAQQEIERLNNFNQSIIQSASEGIIVQDTQGIFRMVNPAGTEIYARREDEIVGRHWKELIPTDQHKIIEAADSERILGKSSRYAVEIEHPNGERRTALVSGSPHFDNGRFVGTISVFTDITSLKKAESEVLQRNRELAALNRAVHLLNHLGTPDEILEIIFDATNLVLDNRNLYIALNDPKNGTISFPVYTINGERQPTLTRSYNNGLTEYILRTREPLILARDMDAEIERLGITAIGSPACSYLGVPIIAGERVLGVIALQDYQAEQAYNTRDLELLTTFASQAAISLENSRLYEAAMLEITERKRAEEKIEIQVEYLNALRDIDEAIASAFDLQSSLDRLIKHAIKLLNVDAASVLLVNSAKGTLEYAAGSGFWTEAIGATSIKLGESYAGRAAKEQRIIQIPNLADEQTNLFHIGFPEAEHFSSYYGCPLFVKGNVIGVLEAFTRSSVEQDAEWLDFFSTLAGQAAIAIDHARLFSDLQSTNLELEKRVQERTSELERANRTKDEFLANMSHELRTPLNSILGLSESLLEQRRGSLNDRQQNSIHVIESSGRHLLELINDVLDLSKIEAGKFDYYPQEITLDDLCRSSLAFVKTMAAKKSISVLYENESAITKIFADPRRLKQILVNLLTNAVKFTLENGQVTLQIYASAEHDLIRFSVIDTGIGISNDNLKKLFKPFVQVDSSLNRQHEGTGLGLALVQRLVDLHGGSVEVESEVGRGSRFTINLPLGQGAMAQYEIVQPVVETVPVEPVEIISTPSGQPAKQGRILLAEDNMANILTIGEYLESYGYDIVVVHDGMEAIKKVEEIKPDIILMDIQMPVMDGLEAMRRIRSDSRFESTPIIALTALAMPGDRERCLAAGANEYISKPASLKSLVKTIRKMLV